MREIGPIRFILGTTPEEVAAAKPYLGIGRVQLGITKNLMQLGGLQQASRSVTLPDGTVIHSQSVLGQDIVRIEAAVAAGVSAAAGQKSAGTVAPKEGTLSKGSRPALVAGTTFVDNQFAYWNSASKLLTPTNLTGQSLFAANTASTDGSIVATTADIDIVVSSAYDSSTGITTITHASDIGPTFGRRILINGFTKADIGDQILYWFEGTPWVSADGSMEVNGYSYDDPFDIVIGTVTTTYYGFLAGQNNPGQERVGSVLRNLAAGTHLLTPITNPTGVSNTGVIVGINSYDDGAHDVSWSNAQGLRDYGLTLFGPVISPDGRVIAAGSTGNNSTAVYVDGARFDSLLYNVTAVSNGP